VGPYSPGIVAGDYLYVSGQGARRGDGTFPARAAAQIRECLEKIKAVAVAAGFSMEGAVYSQVYVRDATAFPQVERAWAEYFPKNGPARSVIGVASLPGDTPVEVNAVVIRDLGAKKAFSVTPAKGPVPDIVLAPDRAFVSDCRGPGGGDVATEVEAALTRMGMVLKAAGLDYRHMVFVNPFMTDAVEYGAMNGV
jgi:enamine deaminase RidA (YjgF/YER057c/UK114 family)